MIEVSVIPRLPVQPVEPDFDVPMDELEESLVPVEEDQLPQGVLDLLAMLMLPHRPMAAAGSREPQLSAAPAKGEGTDRHLPRLDAQTVALNQRPALLFSALLQRPIVQPMAIAAPAVMRIASSEVSLPVIDQSSRLPEIASTERPSIPVEPMSTDQPSPSIEEAIPVSDLELRTGQSSVQVARNAPPVALPVAAQTTAPLSTLLPEVTMEDVAGSSRDFLQIPFNKGTVSGQVTITRTPGESAQNLVLSPSSVQIFEQLERPFELAREPGWQLTDSGDEQQQHGSRQAPDDDESEQQEHLA
ncbi:hypothetical protein [Pseudomonas sp. NPDC086251]|jgi:hypothetical protein|uniref:SpaN/EivJ family type III secretion system needle length determinant n=1 Tax=Pseudomonas sp. NPDC086251 TaxID=3364431 RepID=UPI0038345D75